MIDAFLALGAASPLTLALAGGVLALAESALGVGFVLPGEVGIAGLGGIADTGWARVLLLGAVVLGALAGDHLGYLLGRHVGPRMSGWRVVRRLGPDRWTAAMARIERRGGTAVFVSRLVPVARTIMPAAAGAAGLSYPRFVVASAAGALMWAALWVGTGTFGGELLGGLVHA